MCDLHNPFSLCVRLRERHVSVPAKRRSFYRRLWLDTTKWHTPTANTGPTSGAQGTNTRRYTVFSIASGPGIKSNHIQASSPKKYRYICHIFLHLGSMYYAYIETSSQPSKSVAILAIPLYQYYSCLCLRFDYHMFGQDIGSLEIVTQGSTNYGTTIWDRRGRAYFVPVHMHSR